MLLSRLCRKKERERNSFFDVIFNYNFFKIVIDILFVLSNHVFLPLMLLYHDCRNKD